MKYLLSILLFLPLFSSAQSVIINNRDSTTNFRNSGYYQFSGVLKLPVSNGTAPTFNAKYKNGTKGTVYIDTTNNLLKIYSGSAWTGIMRFSDTASISSRIDLKANITSIVTGASTFTGNSILSTFTVTHGLGSTPTYVLISPNSLLASALHYIDNITGTTFDIVFIAAPGIGSIKFFWLVK